MFKRVYVFPPGEEQFSFTSLARNDTWSFRSSGCSSCTIDCVILCTGSAGPQLYSTHCTGDHNVGSALAFY